jgi:orotate phosphoribosyltransferase
VRSFGGQVEPLLKVTRFVPPLHHSMSPTQRESVVHGAFALAAGSRIAGRTIGIIDDVSTTGATLLEAARVLRRARAKSVVAAVLAKTALAPARRAKALSTPEPSPGPSRG